MTNIEFVTHSKYRSLVDPNHYENELLCLSGHTINGYECTYIYTHDGKIIWHEDSNLDLLNKFKEMKKEFGFVNIVELLKFPIYEKYSDSCQKFVNY